MADSRGHTPGRPRVWRWGVLALGLLLAYCALAHSFEDFAHDVPRDRFGIDPTPAALMLAGAFLVQGAILALVWRDAWLGYAGSVLVGVAWFVAAALDHAGDLLDDAFRTATSDLLIAGILVSSAALAVFSVLALRGPGRGTGRAAPPPSA